METQLDKGVIERLAFRVWETFEKDGIQNSQEGNYLAAENIVNKIISGVYDIDDFKSWLKGDDYEYLKRVKDENLSRLKEDQFGD